MCGCGVEELPLVHHYTTHQQYKQVQPIVAQHKGNGGEEELRLVRHSITNNPSFIYRLQQYQPIFIQERLHACHCSEQLGWYD